MLVGMTNPLSPSTLAASPSRTHRRGWIAPIALLVLALPPVFFGALRFASVILGRPTLPDHARLTTLPAVLLVHIVSATTFALLGALQLAPALRRRPWHRMVGRALAPLGFAAAASGIWMALAVPPGEGGSPLLTGVRVVVGTAMIAFLALGMNAVRSRDFSAHGAWMARAYALGAGAGTQFVLFVPFVQLTGAPPSPAAHAVVMTLGWAINLGIAEGSLRQQVPARASRLVGAALFAAFVTTMVAPRTARADEADTSSTRDVERMKQVLDAAAEAGRDRRVRVGAEAVGQGVALTGIGVASWVTESTPTARESRDVIGGVLVGVGALAMAGGTYALLVPSDIELGRDAYAAALREGPQNLAASAREAERVLLADEREARKDRIATGIATFVFGALEIGGGIAIEASTDDPSLTWLGRGLIAGGVGAGIIGAFELGMRSEEERLADLWRNQRSLPERATSSAPRLTPRIGFGQIGLSGTF